MKKILIGFVSLMAMVILTSPAFGALFDNPFNLPDPVDGSFTFWVDEIGGTKSNLIGVKDLSYLGGPGGGGFGEETVIAALSDWGVTEQYQEFNDDWFSGANSDLKTGSVVFDIPVQVVVAKWDGVSFAFQLDAVKTVEWNDLEYGMSFVRGYNPVPIPAAAWLLGSGMLGLLVVRRRRF